MLQIHRNPALQCWFPIGPKNIHLAEDIETLRPEYEVSFDSG